jgi:hypothetical protein
VFVVDRFQAKSEFVADSGNDAFLLEIDVRPGEPIQFFKDLPRGGDVAGVQSLAEDEQQRDDVSMILFQAINERMCGTHSRFSESGEGIGGERLSLLALSDLRYMNPRRWIKGMIGIIPPNCERSFAAAPKGRRRLHRPFDG